MGKNKAAFARTRSAALARRKKRKILRAAKENTSTAPNIVRRPALCDIKPPAGFMAVSNSQAILSYCRPLLERSDCAKDELPNNDALQIGVGLWNYDIQGGGEPQQALIKKLMQTLKLKTGEAETLFTEMVSRKEYLIPRDIQPDYPLIMFVRKENVYRIERLTYETFHIPEATLPPDADDTKLVTDLRQMDNDIKQRAEYMSWESLFLKMKETNQQLFLRWLNAKGLGSNAESFSWCPDIWLEFIYRYWHDEITLLNMFSVDILLEFFLDHLPRKMYTEPKNYAEWPPALRLYYRFLMEKGYIEDCRDYDQMLETVEPVFIGFLKKRYE